MVPDSEKHHNDAEYTMISQKNQQYLY